MDPNHSKYANFTIPQLKEELKRRNARLSGRKKELIERSVIDKLFKRVEKCMSFRNQVPLVESESKRSWIYLLFAVGILFIIKRKEKDKILFSHCYYKACKDILQLYKPKIDRTCSIS